MAKEKKLKLKEPMAPKKPKAPNKPVKPQEIILEEFEVCIPQLCHFSENDRDDHDDHDEYGYTSNDELKDCFVCNNGLKNTVSCYEISFADLLKIRSKINANDEDITICADSGDCGSYSDFRIVISWNQYIENPNYQDEMKKYHQKLEKIDSEIKKYEIKLKEYEHKLEEYKILKAEFIKQKAEQDLNSLLK